MSTAFNNSNNNGEQRTGVDSSRRPQEARKHIPACEVVIVVVIPFAFEWCFMIQEKDNTGAPCFCCRNDCGGPAIDRTPGPPLAQPIGRIVSSTPVFFFFFSSLIGCQDQRHTENATLKRGEAERMRVIGPEHYRKGRRNGQHQFAKPAIGSRNTFP
ncbi:extracellular subtilisin-like serine proteinase precursor [Anopheles sinensis]|uniref:Extracellular subtilisin-like serine proteinase n=1 Tax=Anopheles sinensis TaxID=74873 RepID=A0A084VEY9_ANOSI|nr:extracellular subtilisin-like serine proteinase precursor [Anopheles sinensis]